MCWLWRTTHKKKLKTEDVALSGPQGKADIKKKKKKVALVPHAYEHFEFIDVMENWKFMLNEADLTAFTHTSSFVGNVRYDRDTHEMRILLNSSPYNFCNVSERLYDSFEGASSKGAFFNREIKSLHDC